MQMSRIQMSISTRVEKRLLLFDTMLFDTVSNKQTIQLRKRERCIRYFSIKDFDEVPNKSIIHERDDARP